MVACPSFHWADRIPPEVRCKWRMAPEQVNEEAKGWLLFVEVRNAAPNLQQSDDNKILYLMVSGTMGPRAAANITDEDGDYEVRRRRALVETWAKASQEFCDVCLSLSLP